MNSIYATEGQIKQANPVDIYQFFRTILSEPNGKYCGETKSLSIGLITEEPHKQSNLMTIIKINFQIWEKGEDGEGAKYVWICSRAKDGSCHNISIETR